MFDEDKAEQAEARDNLILAIGALKAAVAQLEKDALAGRWEDPCETEGALPVVVELQQHLGEVGDRIVKSLEAYDD